MIFLTGDHLRIQEFIDRARSAAWVLAGDQFGIDLYFWSLQVFCPVKVEAEVIQLFSGFPGEQDAIFLVFCIKGDDANSAGVTGSRGSVV